MTVVNPKSISGINSITTGSGSDNLLTIHTSDASSTERVRINSSGDVIVGSGITASPDGNIFATGVTTATTFVGALTGNVTGNISGGTVAGSTGTFTGAVTLADGVANGLKIGAGEDLVLQHNGTNSFIDNNTGDLYIQTTGSGDDILIESADDITLKVAGSETAIQATGDGAVELYHNGTKKIETAAEGVVIPSGANNCVRIFGSNAVHATSALIIGQNNTTTSQLRAYGPDSSTNGKIELRSSRGGDGSNTVNLIYDGNLNFASGYGIDFSATANSGGSMSSELLDDYEEGTFTPTLYYVSGTSGVAYSIQQGRYTKVGRNVSFQMRIQLSNKGSGNNNIRLGGLPFTPSTSGVDYDYFLITAVIGMNLGSGTIIPFAQMEDYSAGRITLYSYDYSSSSNYGTIGNSQVTDTLYIGLQGNYVTTA